MDRRLQQHLRNFFGVALVLLALALGGCAVSPRSAADWQRSEAHWSEQLNAIPQPGDATRKPRLWVLAAGLNDQSKAFEGDVEGFTRAVKEVNPEAVVLAMNNPHMGGELKRPFGTRENLRRALQLMGERMNKGDSALVLLSTHGHVNVLAVGAGNEAYPLINGQELGQLLLPLKAHPTGIIVSACYSGSLINSLKEPNRWIMTAAAPNRNSFGCNFSSTQTFFVKALLDNMGSNPESLEAWFNGTRNSVHTMELAAKVPLSSNPQLWVGPRMEKSLAGYGLMPFFRPTAPASTAVAGADL